MGPSSFRFAYVDSYVEAACTWLHAEAEVVDTGSLTPVETAEQIARSLAC